MKFPLLLALFIYLMSCVSYPKELTKVGLSKNCSFNLLSEHNWRPLSALQKITVDWQGKALTFNVQLEISENGVYLIGLTPVFSRSFLISYENRFLNFSEHPYFKYPVKPENMLADFQLVFAEANQIVIEGGQLISDSQKREIFINNKKAIAITYSNKNKWESEIHFENLLHGYKLKINTLEFNNL